MAKVKFTAIVADMRGKLAGTVFSKNRGGSYARTKVTPVNPQSAAQTEVRSLLASFTQGFKALTQSQIAAWNTAVANFQSTDIFGDLKSPSGINLYTKLNMNLSLAGASNIVTPPIPSTVEGLILDATVCYSSPATLTIQSALAAVPAGHELIIEATPQLSPGKNFVKSEFRVIGTRSAATAFPITATIDYTDKFGAPVAGQKVFVRVKTINTTTGLASQYSVASTITL